MTHPRRPRSTSRPARSPRSRPPGGPRKPPGRHFSKGAGPADDRPRPQPLDNSFYSTPSAGRYRDGGPPITQKRGKKRSRKETVMLSVEDYGVLCRRICQTLWLAINHMAFGLFWGAISAGTSFWFTFWSPFARPINGLCQMLNTINLPLKIVLQPELCVFFVAGVGITYSLMQVCDAELKNTREYSNLVAGLSAVLAWLMMQWILTETLAQNLARFTTILALGFVVSLGIYNVVYIVTMLLTTYGTFWAIVRFELWEPTVLNQLFKPAVGLTASPETCAAMIVFFGLVGLTLGFWNVLAQKVVVPFLHSRMTTVSRR